MFYVYYGYLGPDHYDCSEGDPLYEIQECQTEEQVVALKEEFEEDTDDDDISHKVFRVFEGKERFLGPKEIVKSYAFR